MTIEHEKLAADDFALVGCGPSHRLAEHLGLSDQSALRRSLKVLLLFVVTWLPLVVLALAAGHLWGNEVAVPLLSDPEIHGRFLFVLPVLELARGVVAVSLAVQARHFLEMGIVPARENTRFQAARAQVVGLRESKWAELTILVLALSIPLVTRLALGFNTGTSSWERVGSSLTLAGWWHTVVSLPILFFFLLRWVWIFLLWATFLFRVSRLDLELTPTHPDRAGGLGFVGWGLASFALVLMAVSGVFSAAFADEIFHHGESINSLKYHVIVFAVVVLVVLHAPLLSFSGKLARCRFQGLLEFGKLVWQHDRAFDEKWIKNPADPSCKNLLGSADIQSLASVATPYEHVDRMWLMPFDVKAFAVLFLAILLPMIPLLGTAIPLQEIFLKLGELLL